MKLQIKYREHLIEAGAFVLTLVLAFWFKWQLLDLVWSLWISSLLGGAAMIVSPFLISIFTPLPAEARQELLLLPTRSTGLSLRISIGLGVCLVLLVVIVPLLAVFAFFHCLHGFVLNGLMPLLDLEAMGLAAQPGLQELLALAKHSAQLYWPFIVLVFISNLCTMYRLCSGDAGLMIVFPWISVVKMHILIFVFGICFALGQTSAALVGFLALSFFPWEQQMLRSSKNRRVDQVSSS